jgi:MoxR-like ATPase
MIAFLRVNDEDARLLNAFIAEHWTDDLAFDLEEGLLDNFLVAQVPIWTWIEYPDKCLSAAIGISAIAGKEATKELSPLQRVMLKEYLKEWEGVPIEVGPEGFHSAAQVETARRAAAAIGPVRGTHELGEIVSDALSGDADLPSDIRAYRELMPASIWVMVERHLG